MSHDSEFEYPKNTTLTITLQVTMEHPAEMSPTEVLTHVKTWGDEYSLCGNVDSVIAMDSCMIDVSE